MSTFTKQQTLQAITVLEDLLREPFRLGGSGICLYVSESLRDKYDWPWLERARFTTFVESLMYEVRVDMQQIPVSNSPWIAPKGEWTPIREKLALTVIEKLRTLHTAE